MLMIATLLIYSGVENPQWAVPSAVEAKMARAIAALVPIPDRACDAATGLGYAGVMLRLGEPGSVERTFTFHEGVIAGDGKCYADRDRAIEKMLLESGRGIISSDLVDSIIAT